MSTTTTAAYNNGSGGGYSILDKHMSAREREASDRRFVVMCALESLPPVATATSVGFKLFVGELAPGYAGFGATIHPTAVDAVRLDLTARVRGTVAEALARQHRSCRRLGWPGPFVGLQVDVTSGHGGAEVCTASVSFVPEDFAGLVRLAVGVRCFYGGVTAPGMEEWIREVRCNSQ